jgi:hypothetical protein
MEPESVFFTAYLGHFRIQIRSHGEWIATGTLAE